MKAARKLGVKDGDKEHLEEKQNMWDYASFVLYLQEKSAMDFTGPEAYISHLLEGEDNNWIPSLRCSLLERAGEVDGQSNMDLEQKMGALEQNMKKMMQCVTDFGTKLDADIASRNSAQELETNAPLEVPAERSEGRHSTHFRGEDGNLRRSADAEDVPSTPTLPSPPEPPQSMVRQESA